MELVTFIIGAIIGAGATQLYHVKLKVNVNQKNQKQKGGDNSTNYQAGRNIDRSGNDG